MRTSYSLTWTYVVLSVLLKTTGAFAYQPIPPTSWGTATPGMSAPMGGMPMNTMSADEVALDRDALSLETQLRDATGGGMPTTAAYPGAQPMMPPVAPSYAASGVVYGSQNNPFAGVVGSPGGTMGTGYGSSVVTAGPFAGAVGSPGGSAAGTGNPMMTLKTFGSVSARTVFDLCTQIIEQRKMLDDRDNQAFFTSMCVQLESAFTYCNFSEVSAANSDITVASLSAIAAKAAAIIVENITDGIDSIQKNIADIILSETQAVKKTSRQDRWKSAGWMLAAAAANTSFRRSLATDSSETHGDNPATAFWKAFSKVFSIQPVSRRMEMPTPRGTVEWREVPEELGIISDLFKAARRLNAARNTGDLTKKEEENFVLGTRAFSKILTLSTFANGSIGLQQFAFRIFNEYIYGWLEDRSGPAKLRHEYWIVAAEAFNLMYSGIIGSAYIFPRNINIGSNHFASDHIDFKSENGTMSMNLKNTYLTNYEDRLKKIADTFTMHFSRIGVFKGFFESVKPVNLIAQNESDLLVLMLCSEACEYTMNKTQAPNCANLIGYFFEKGFSFNNKVVNWSTVSSGAACLTIITLNRLLQKTATSLAGNAVGDYNSVPLYQGLLYAHAAINVASDRFPTTVQKALSPMLPQLQKDKAQLQKYMSSRNALKKIRAPEIVLTTAEQNGVRPIIRPMISAPIAGYAPQPYPAGYTAAGYGARPGYPATGYQASYGAPQQLRTGVPVRSFNMGVVPQAPTMRTGFAGSPQRPYPAGYTRQPQYATTGPAYRY